MDMDDDGGVSVGCRNVAAMARGFLDQFPETGVRCFYFKGVAETSPVAGFYCTSGSVPGDVDVVENLLGCIDIPAGMNGMVCKMVSSNNGKKVYLFVFDRDAIHPDNLDKLRFATLGSV